MPATEATASLEDSAAPLQSLNGPAEDESRRAATGWHLPGVSWFVLSGIVVLLSAVVAQGADLLWSVAIGDRIRAGDGIPRSIPFAAAPTDGWTSPMAFGEVLLSVVHSMGPAALIVLHLALVATALGVLLAPHQSGQREARASTALLLVTVGGASTLAIARMPSLSLLPYAALIVLLLQNADRPSRRLWLAVPLVTVWGNLHGGVLVGCALLSVHLICCDGPLRRRAFVGAASLAGVLLATSAGWHTFSYYQAVLGNEAARQHVGLWARPRIHNPLDLLMLLAAMVLIAMWARSRPRLWEIVAIVGMGTATLLAARNSIWLLLLLLPLAARGRSRARLAQRRPFAIIPLVTAVAIALVGVGWQMVTRGPGLTARGSGAVATVRQLAAGGTVLAVDPAEETFAQAGIRIWAGNPIDAFPHEVQRQYLAFVDHGAIPTSPRVDLIVVDNKLAAEVRSAGCKQVAAVDGLLIFEPPTPPRTGRN
ncbi:hypothetical protein [Flexivirga sp.]|uniref:hypothetical protein n=1 Tax=Flexivirga sp. TaxID=1962927 RepID=UPI003F819B17